MSAEYQVNGSVAVITLNNPPVNGLGLATRSAADQACTQSLGAGYRVADAASLGGVFKLTGGNEYWVHNDLRTENNCWAGDTR